VKGRRERFSAFDIGKGRGCVLPARSEVPARSRCGRDPVQSFFGGNGQLGQELARAAALQSIPMKTLSHGEADIANPAAVAAALSRINPALVVNAAAYYQGRPGRDEYRRGTSL